MTGFEAEAVTAERWEDMESLFGVRGACGGCWCMYWRQAARDFEANKGENNRRVMQNLIENGEIPGLIGYLDGATAGWIAIAPRKATPRLENSRILKRVDDRPVWSISCLFVDREFRNRGVSGALIEAACDYAFSQGAEIVEGYPHDLPAGERQPAPFVWTGIASAFRRAGFREVERRSPKRPIMRIKQSQK